MSKLAFLISSLRSGGAEKVCVGLLNEFARQEYDVCLIVLNSHNANLAKYLNPNIKIYDLKQGRAAFSFFSLAKLLRKLEIKSCLSFNFQLSVQLVLVKKFFGLDFILYSRGINTFSRKISEETSFQHRYVNPILIKKLYKKSDFFIAQSTGMRDDMITTLGVPGSKIKIIHNPAFSLYEGLKPVTGTPSRAIKEILFVGSLKNQKNLPFLLDSIAALRYLRSDFVFRIVGDGSLKKHLEQKVDEMVMSDFVFFEGYSERPGSYFKSADVFVLGSLYEGFPNVLIESLSYGVPVVSIDCMSGPSDIIEPGINGYLVSSYDSQDFAKKINLALEKDWDLNALSESIRHFGFNNVFEQYKNYLLYEEI